jgi:hypothetical protein
MAALFVLAAVLMAHDGHLFLAFIALLCADAAWR